MPRDKFNIVIYRGESFTTEVQLKDSNNTPISLSGATLTSSCRSKSTNTQLFTFTCSVVNPAANGVFNLTLPANASSSLTPQKNLVYDVKISWVGGDTKYWLGGDVEIIDTITQ